MCRGVPQGIDGKDMYVYHNPTECAVCGSEGEEGAEIQKVIGSAMPLLGIYTGVELGAVSGQQQALDWSGVLCVFSE